MHVAKIELMGPTGAFANLARRKGSDVIEVEIILPTTTHKHRVDATCKEDRRSMAECIQLHLDGRHGTRASVATYMLAMDFIAD